MFHHGSDPRYTEIAPYALHWNLVSSHRLIHGAVYSHAIGSKISNIPVTHDSGKTKIYLRIDLSPLILDTFLRFQWDIFFQPPFLLHPVLQYLFLLLFPLFQEFIPEISAFIPSPLKFIRRKIINGWMWPCTVVISVCIFHQFACIPECLEISDPYVISLQWIMKGFNVAVILRRVFLYVFQSYSK